MDSNTTKKIVYVLVSNCDDHFTEMAILSVTCARIYSPGLEIELIIDKRSYNELYGYRKTILDMVDSVQVVDILGKDNAFTSRIIKTQLRSIIKGNYLYIDIDAIPVAPLDKLFECTDDIAMAHDHNVPPHKFVFYDYEREIFDKMTWPLPKRYFNSGVMFVKDNSRVHQFFNIWHGLWLQNSQIGLHKDQPPMHEAIRRSDISVKSLGPEWNILIGLQKGYGAKKPGVYHYSTIRFESRSDTFFHEIVKKMKLEEKINLSLLHKVVESKYPWTNEHSIRLNWAVGNYKIIPLLILKKIIDKST